MSDFAITPIRLTSTMDERVTDLAKKLGKSKQDTMRLCMEIGANWIVAHGYDLSQKIVPFDVVKTLRDLLDTAIERLSKEADRLAEVPHNEWKITELLGPEEMAASRAAEGGQAAEPLTSDTPEYQAKPQKKGRGK